MNSRKGRLVGRNNLARSMEIQKDSDTEEKVTGMEVTMKISYICLTAVPEEEERDQNRGNIRKDDS